MSSEEKGALCPLQGLWGLSWCAESGLLSVVFKTSDIFYNKTVHWSVTGVHDCSYNRHRQDL